MAIAALVAGIIWVATKTTWFQTIWEYTSHAIGAAWTWLWNTILAPVIRFVLNGFASITDGIASMLNTLSNIPGFGWAKTAADKMSGAADKARALAKGIKDIPDKKVDISVTANYSPKAQQILNLANLTNKRAALGFRFAAGGGVPGVGTGDTVPAMLTPGEFVVRRDGSNIADALNHFGAKAVTPGFDYDRLARAFSRVHVQSYLDGQNVTAAVDRRVGAALR
jgi:hypothetical protein